MKRHFTFLFFLFCLPFIRTELFAATITSGKSGNWGATGTWEGDKVPGSGDDVIIATGTTVTLEVGKSCKSLIIEPGATLNSISNGSTTVFLRVGATGTGTITTFTNNGTFGGSAATPTVGDGIALEFPTQCKQLTYTGNGVANIYRFRINSGNTNNPVSFIIDGNMNFTGPFTAYYNNTSNATTDDYSVTINAGKTVAFIAAAGSFHNTSPSNTNPGGKYTYNIDGTLDLSLTTTTPYLRLSSSATSLVILNVNGTLKLGTGGLNIKQANDNGNPPVTITALGSVSLNIGNTGIVDASLTPENKFLFENNYFISNGNGVIKRAVDGSDTSFPIGTSSSSFSPVTLNNSGISSIVAVSIKNTFDQAPSQPSKVVNKQWSIVPETAGANLEINLGWASSDQAASFVPTNPIVIAGNNGSAWIESAATIEGTGPYVASVSGVTSFGNFAVGNSGTLPLNFLSFTAKPDALGKSVNLNWQTTNEVNTKEFIIEKRTDNTEFRAIDTKASNNTAGIHNYTYTDNNVSAGLTYYRLKQIDKEGVFDYSNITSADIKGNLSFSIYPNPTADILDIVHEAALISSTIKVLNLSGKTLIDNVVTAGSTTTNINVSALSSGVYVLVYDGLNQQNALKFIKK